MACTINTMDDTTAPTSEPAPPTGEDIDLIIEAVQTLHAGHHDLRRRAMEAKQNRDAGIRTLYNRGFTQQQIADVVGILQPEISKIVRGMRQPRRPMREHDHRHQHG